MESMTDVRTEGRLPGALIPVVADGALAIPEVDQGRLIAVAMVDTTETVELAEFIRIHQHVQLGDVRSQWATVGRHPNEMILILNFDSPVEFTVGLVFDMEHRAGVVDQIIRSQSMYLQHGVEGDTVTSTMENPRIHIDLPSTGFESRWEKVLRRHLESNFRNRGLTRRQAQLAADRTIIMWRDFGSVRATYPGVAGRATD